MVKKRVVVVGLWTLLLSLAVVPIALAEEEGGGLDPTTKSSIALAGGFGIAIAAIGGALAQGRAISAGLEGIARNPGAAGKIQTPLIIGLAFVESLVLYALVVSFILVLKF